MQLVDSHCHLDRVSVSEEFSDINQQIQYTREQGIEWMLNVSIDKCNWDDVVKIAQDNTGVYASIGVHPDSKDTADITYSELLEASKQAKVIAIGETGLDYFHDEIPPLDQKQSFSTHIEVAIETQLPLIIHTRQAKKDTIDILKSNHAEKIGGVMHCFTETLDMAKQAIDLGFYISLSGILTFNSAKDLQEVARVLPLDRLLIETDSPYLAPTPYRGKRNQPLYVQHVAQKLADIKQCSVDEIAATTTDNFFQLFSNAVRSV